MVCTSDLYLKRAALPPEADGWSFVALDRPEAGRVLARFALAKGVRTLAFADPSEILLAPCREFALAAGIEFHHIPNFDANVLRPRPLAAFLHRLPQGSLLVIPDESMAEQVLEICRLEDLDIPGRLGLLTVSPDGLICDSVRPSISYAPLPFRQIGYEAARALDARLANPSLPPLRLRLAPTRIAERASTAFRRSGDPVADVILERIHRQCRHPTSVNDLLERLAIKRRAAERRFRVAVGHTIRGAIERERLRVARELLETTDLPVVDVAARAGFSCPSLFCAVFRKAYAVTPARFRATIRTGARSG